MKIEPDELGLRLVHHQLAVDDVVAERRDAAHPHAACAREAANLSRMRSPITSRSNWANDEQDVERQPAHRRRRVELLRDADERDVVLVEYLDNAGEVGQRAADSRSTL